MDDTPTTAWDGWPSEPERDGWYWIDGGNGPQVMKWASQARKWKRAGRQTAIPPHAAVAAGWLLIKECRL